MERLGRVLKNSAFIMATLSLLLGVVLVCYPALTARLICYLIGLVLVIYGVTRIISYFSIRSQGALFSVSLFVGLMTLALGIFIMVRSDIVVSIVPILFGLYLLIDGFSNVQKAFALKTMGAQRWWLILIFSVLSVILGIVFLFNPFKMALTGIVFIGISLIYNSVINFWTIIALSKAQ